MTATAAASENYVAASRRLFDHLCTIEVDPATPVPSLFTLELIADFGELHKIYTEELRNLLGSALKAFGANEESQIWKAAGSTYFYEKGIPSYVSICLFWLWENRVAMTDEDLTAIVQAVLEGNIGYRLIDLHLDDQTIGPEGVVLGNCLVRAHEDRLATVFGDEIARPILKKYADMYAEVEFLEKSHRWKACPFSWNNAERLGWKGAPLVAVLHLMMQGAARPARHAEASASAMLRVLAAHQLIDDWHDAFSDLAKGTETLVAAGFFNWNEEQPVTKSRVQEFLDQPRMRPYITQVLALLDSAIRDLDAIDEPILALQAERVKNRVLGTIAVETKDGRGDETRTANM